MGDNLYLTYGQPGNYICTRIARIPLSGGPVVQSPWRAFSGISVVAYGAVWSPSKLAQRHQRTGASTSWTRPPSRSSVRSPSPAHTTMVTGGQRWAHLDRRPQWNCSRAGGRPHGSVHEGSSSRITEVPVGAAGRGTRRRHALCRGRQSSEPHLVRGDREVPALDRPLRSRSRQRAVPGGVSRRCDREPSVGLAHGRYGL